jgi:leader peptidase (prepilin peptidase)/N-methyltransferase
VRIVPIICLLALALTIERLNSSRFLREYRAYRLPKARALVFILVAPLVLVDHRNFVPALQISWLTLLTIGILACFIDQEHHLLPDRLILPAVAISVPLVASANRIIPALVGGGVWSLGFALLALINPKGLGWGDVKFATLLGINCGSIDLKLVPIAIFISFGLGGAYSVVLIARGNRRTQIAFGPFMMIGAVTALLSG